MPAEYPDLPRVAVGAVVIHQERVLLVERANPPSKGVWAVPGGSVELGETLQEATEREVLEEAGVTIRAGDPIYCFDSVIRDREGRVRYHYVIIDLVADYVSGELVAGDDASGARWVAADELDALGVSPLTRDLLAAKLGFGV